MTPTHAFNPPTSIFTLQPKAERFGLKHGVKREASRRHGPYLLYLRGETVLRSLVVFTYTHCGFSLSRTASTQRHLKETLQWGNAATGFNT